MTPIRPCTAKRLGLRRPSLPDEPYALATLAFPMPEGATAWRCLYGKCSARGHYYLSREAAELSAIEHVSREHVWPKGLAVEEAGANLKHALGL